DRDDQLWATLIAWLFPDAFVADKSLGPRRVRARGCHPEFVVGNRPALRRRNSRSLRHQPRAVCRRGFVRARPRDHGAVDYARSARSVRGGAYRPRIVGLLIQHRTWRLRSVAA